MEIKIIESAKSLFQVFTDKILFVEWILQVLRSITLYFLKIKASMEVEVFTKTNKEIDLRNIPKNIRPNIIHDEAVLKMRWDLCTSCEFLTDNNSCSKCGCYMAVKHQLKQASCPLNPPKWDKYKEEVANGIITA